MKRRLERADQKGYLLGETPKERWNMVEKALALS